MGGQRPSFAPVYLLFLLATAVGRYGSTDRLSGSTSAELKYRLHPGRPRQHIKDTVWRRVPPAITPAAANKGEAADIQISATDTQTIGYTPASAPAISLNEPVSTTIKKAARSSNAFRRRAKADDAQHTPLSRQRLQKPHEVAFPHLSAQPVDYSDYVRTKSGLSDRYAVSDACRYNRTPCRRGSALGRRRSRETGHGTTGGTVARRIVRGPWAAIATHPICAFLQCTEQNNSRGRERAMWPYVNQRHMQQLGLGKPTGFPRRVAPKESRSATNIGGEEETQAKSFDCQAATPAGALAHHAAGVTVSSVLRRTTRSPMEALSFTQECVTASARKERHIQAFPCGATENSVVATELGGEADAPERRVEGCGRNMDALLASFTKESTTGASLGDSETDDSSPPRRIGDGGFDVPQWASPHVGSAPDTSPTVQALSKLPPAEPWNSYGNDAHHQRPSEAASTRLVQIRYASWKYDSTLVSKGAGHQNQGDLCEMRPPQHTPLFEYFVSYVDLSRCTPVLHFRWHSQESFVDAAAHVLNTSGRPFFYVVAGEYAETPIRRVGMFHAGFVSTLGPIRHWPAPPASEHVADTRSCPFLIPSVNDLLAALPKGSKRTAYQTRGTASNAESTEYDIREFQGGRREQMAGKKPRIPVLLRWLPFGFQRKISGFQSDNAATRETTEIREVEDLVHVLQKKLTMPLKTQDGRDVVVIINDRLPEVELILRKAFRHAALNLSFSLHVDISATPKTVRPAVFGSGACSPAGTPVIVTDTEAFSPDDALSRVQLRSPSGEKLHFVVLGYGRYGQLPLDTAFLDRALVRVPKAEDIRAFVADRAGQPEESVEASGEQAGLERMQRTAEKKGIYQHLSPGQGNAGAYLNATSSIPDVNFFVLNPFTDLLLRFNYTEVDSVLKYAAGLTEELRNARINFLYKNKTRRVAIVLLTDLPEAEHAFPSGLVKLNMIVQATIAVSMIIAFLACLCMCRMMHLLKTPATQWSWTQTKRVITDCFALVNRAAAAGRLLFAADTLESLLDDWTRARATMLSPAVLILHSALRCKKLGYTHFVRRKSTVREEAARHATTGGDATRGGYVTTGGQATTECIL